MTRENKGIIGFTSLTVIAITALCLAFGFSTLPIASGGIAVFAFMVGREVYQYRTRQTPVFEYEDVVEYGIFIAVTTAAYLIAVAIFTEL